MATGFSFIDDPQMSVREKIDRYFQKKKNSEPVVLDESTSDESIVNSFCEFDQSFAELLNNNSHVTLIRNSKKANATQTDVQTMMAQVPQAEHHDDELEEFLRRTPPSKPQTAPYMPTPTRRGEARKPIKTDDSIEIDPLSLWYVSDESFVEMEKSCQSLRENDVNDTTLLYDVQEPSFLVNSIDFDDQLDDSVFEHRPNMSLLSPMKQVAMRRPSTIMEESTIRSINSSDERSGSSLSLKHSLREVDEVKKSPVGTLPVVAVDANKSKSRSYRPSLLNVFPTRSRIGFYDNFDSTSISASAQPSATKQNKENASNSMRFETVDPKTPTSSAKPSTANQRSGKENSINLMGFESLDLQSPPSTSPLKPTAILSANRNRNRGLIDSSIVVVDEESSFSNLSVDRTQHDSSMSDSEPPDQFNDTLEAVDYYMKQGKKIMNKTIASSTTLHQQQPCVVASPKNRNNSLLKQTLLARTHQMSVNSDTKLAKKSLF